MKKMTPEQQVKHDRIEKKIANVFWGIVALAMILYGVLYQGGM